MADYHDDVIKWKHFPRYWPFVRGIHRSPVNSPHKGQWRGALMFSMICARINGWVYNGEAGDLRRNRAHYDVTVMRRSKNHTPETGDSLNIQTHGNFNYGDDIVSRPFHHYNGNPYTFIVVLKHKSGSIYYTFKMYLSISTLIYIILLHWNTAGILIKYPHLLSEYHGYWWYDNTTSRVSHYIDSITPK